MTEWQTLAEQTPMGQSRRVECPQCGVGTGTTAAIVNHKPQGYSVHCFACDLNDFVGKGVQTLDELKRIEDLNNHAKSVVLKLELPHDFTNEIPLHGRLWLYSGGIRPSQWTEFNIGYSAELDRVVLPVYDDRGVLIWYQCRALNKGQRPKYMQPSAPRDSVLFKSSPNDTDTPSAVIVEDILSAIRVGTQITAISLLGTKITTAQSTKLHRFEKVITWLDGDKAGLQGSYAIRKALCLVTTVSNIVTAKDPKAYSDQEIEEILSGVH